ncbi:spermidine hydroxycinnamoyl transferase-like [Quillaja saponaria]|uniref:Spermidine hydroxycinnamoyl transferase-like n=1 Tax=Quillaja saponaria TaxID=32244 RepID=A0AAD7LP56_QUISA|nr:spermidine hydroxycinnamoyl transferase-like [Quillaja saponaria]
MVTITSSYTVFPSEPTPKISMWLSESDQINPWTHTPMIFVYKPNHIINNPIETLKISLAKILVHYYPLAGRLRWIGGGRLQVDCNGKGAQLLEAESTKNMAEYGDFEPSEAIKDLLPHVDYNSCPIEDVPLLLVQLTKFLCGGLILGFKPSHMLVDGLATAHFINSWAKLARGERLEENELPFLNRTVLKSFEPLMSPRYDHNELKELPLILGCSDNMSERLKKTRVTLLRLTKKQVEKLKGKANEDRLSSQSRPYSRYEAVAGHIWRSASRARHGTDKLKYHQPTVVRFTADVRNRLNPPLPANYCGNALLRSVTPTCFLGDIISKPLSYSAQKIREATEILTEDFLRSQLDFITRQQNVEWLRASFHIVNYVKGPFFGNPNMSIGSWLSLPMYREDFGWGKPVYVGPGSLNDDGKTFIMPTGPDGDGSIIVALRLQTIHMEAFKRFFYNHISASNL